MPQSLRGRAGPPPQVPKRWLPPTTPGKTMFQLLCSELQILRTQIFNFFSSPVPDQQMCPKCCLSIPSRQFFRKTHRKHEHPLCSCVDSDSECQALF